MSDAPSAPPPEPSPWPVLESQRGADLMIFQSRVDAARSPRTGVIHPRLVLEAPTWVNVVAITPDERMVLVRQWRFGRQVVTTEIPGGVVDPGEDPLEAARRELREETGYTAETWSLLGVVEPNPAFQDNLCFHYLARGAAHTHEQCFDPGEDLDVLLLALDEVRAAVREGRIRHSLVISALARVLDLRA